MLAVLFLSIIANCIAFELTLSEEKNNKDGVILKVLKDHEIAAAFSGTAAEIVGTSCAQGLLDFSTWYDGTILASAMSKLEQSLDTDYVASPSLRKKMHNIFRTVVNRHTSALGEESVEMFARYNITLFPVTRRRRSIVVGFIAHAIFAKILDYFTAPGHDGYKLSREFDELYSHMREDVAFAIWELKVQIIVDDVHRYYSDALDKTMSALFHQHQFSPIMFKDDEEFRALLDHIYVDTADISSSLVGKFGTMALNIVKAKPVEMRGDKLLIEVCIPITVKSHPLYQLEAMGHFTEDSNFLVLPHLPKFIIDVDGKGDLDNVLVVHMEECSFIGTMVICPRFYAQETGCSLRINDRTSCGFTAIESRERDFTYVRHLHGLLVGTTKIRDAVFVENGVRSHVEMEKTSFIAKIPENGSLEIGSRSFATNSIDAMELSFGKYQTTPLKVDHAGEFERQPREWKTIQQLKAQDEKNNLYFYFLFSIVLIIFFVVIILLICCCVHRKHFDYAVRVAKILRTAKDEIFDIQLDGINGETN